MWQHDVGFPSHQVIGVLHAVIQGLTPLHFMASLSQGDDSQLGVCWLPAGHLASTEDTSDCHDGGYPWHLVGWG
jgi:hypothetical protein